MFGRTAKRSCEVLAVKETKINLLAVLSCSHTSPKRKSPMRTLHLGILGFSLLGRTNSFVGILAMVHWSDRETYDCFDKIVGGAWLRHNQHPRSNKGRRSLLRYDGNSEGRGDMGM